MSDYTVRRMFMNGVSFAGPPVYFGITTWQKENLKEMVEAHRQRAQEDKDEAGSDAFSRILVELEGIKPDDSRRWTKEEWRQWEARQRKKEWEREEQERRAAYHARYTF